MDKAAFGEQVLAMYRQGKLTGAFLKKALEQDHFDREVLRIKEQLRAIVYDVNGRDPFGSMWTNIAALRFNEWYSDGGGI